MTYDFSLYGPTLKAMRDENGLPAKAVFGDGLTEWRLRAIESGRPPLTKAEFDLICSRLGVTPEEVRAFRKGSLKLRVSDEYRDRLFSIVSKEGDSELLYLIIVAKTVNDAEKGIDQDQEYWKQEGLIPAELRDLFARKSTNREAKFWVSAASDSIRPGGLGFDDSANELELIDELRNYPYAANWGDEA